MWPYVTEYPFPVGTYVTMMIAGFAVGHRLLVRDFRRFGVAQREADTTILIACAFGIAGAKLAWQAGEAAAFRWADLLSGRGLTWHGGLLLAVAALIVHWWARRLDVRTMLDATAPVAALGYALGRIGCLLSGDGDYGVPCGLLADETACWVVSGYGQGFDVCLMNGLPGLCMSFPDGVVPTVVPVHPTPLYEAVASLLLFMVLRASRSRLRIPGMTASLYLAASGFLRFAVEFLRRSEGRPDRWLGLRDAQIVSLALLLAGVVLAAVLGVRRAPKVPVNTDS
jgi:phosphatidylglycerol:prolipoprotein diacylglycerol transferase